jgi:hypothetical protein
MAKSIDRPNGHSVPIPCDTRPVLVGMIFDAGNLGCYHFDDIPPCDRVPIITELLLTNWRTIDSTVRGGGDSKAHKFITAGKAGEECSDEEVVLVILADVSREGLVIPMFRLCVFDKYSSSEDTLHILDINRVFVSAVYIGIPTPRFSGFLKRLPPSRYNRQRKA